MDSDYFIDFVIIVDSKFKFVYLIDREHMEMKFCFPRDKVLTQKYTSIQPSHIHCAPRKKYDYKPKEHGKMMRLSLNVRSFWSTQLIDILSAQ